MHPPPSPVPSRVFPVPVAASSVGVLVALLALPLGAGAAWTDAPLETLGDDHRVREGHAGAPADIAADAERAARGVVIGRTAAHDALLRARPWEAEDAWVADVGVLLHRDEDGDGFYGTVDLSIDVDTTGTERDVYAIVELTEPGGFLTLSHVTRTFTVRGHATSDEYRIEIELLDDHPAAYRDARIEIRDAWTDERLDEVSAYTFASLRGLPLEAERAFGPADHGRHPHAQTDYALGVLLTGSSAGGHHTYRESDAFVAGYAGAGGPPGLLALLALAAGRVLLRRRGDTSARHRSRRRRAIAERATP